MAVLRIVPNLAAGRLDESRALWQDAIGLPVATDLGSIGTFGAPRAPQVSVMAEGGSGVDVPAISIEVDDLDATLGPRRGSCGGLRPHQRAVGRLPISRPRPLGARHQRPNPGRLTAARERTFSGEWVQNGSIQGSKLTAIVHSRP